MEQRGPRWESDYAEFVAAYAARLRRQAYLQCGDWSLADRALASVLRALYRRWPQLGNEPPDVFAERRLADEARRLRPAGALTASPDDLPPAATIETGALIVRERRRRRQRRQHGRRRAGGGRPIGRCQPGNLRQR